MGRKSLRLTSTILAEKLSKGESPKQIAEEYDCSVQNVYYKIQQAKAKLSKAVIIDKDPGVLQEFSTALDRMNGTLETLYLHLEAINALIVDEPISNFKKKSEFDRIERLYRMMANMNREIRGQVETMLRFSKVVYDTEETKKFQDIILNVIGEEEPRIKKRILERLKGEKALSALVNTVNQGV